MAYRLGEYVAYGELYNTRHYSTHGFIALRGAREGDDTIVRIELTGNCGPDLKGKHFRFMPGENNSDDAVFRGTSMRLHPQQIGPTSTMTAQGWVRELPCSVEEFYHRATLGEPPPTRWVRHLYLEWYSQNGRVLVEMADSVVEECTREPIGDDDEGEWVEIPNLALPPRHLDDPSSAGLGIAVVRFNGGSPAIEHWVASSEQDSGDMADTDVLEDSTYDCDYSEEGEDEDHAIAECELMEHCIDHCEGKQLASLLGDVDKLPRPEELDDEEVETQLKIILGRLAMFQVGLAVCDHYTPRDCYRLLLDSLLHEAETFVELVGTGWVTNLMTHEYCDECDAKSAREYEEFKSEQP